MKPAGPEPRYRAEVRFIDTWGVDEDVVLHVEDASGGIHYPPKDAEDRRIAVRIRGGHIAREGIWVFHVLAAEKP